MRVPDEDRVRLLEILRRHANRMHAGATVVVRIQQEHIAAIRQLVVRPTEPADDERVGILRRWSAGGDRRQALAGRILLHRRLCALCRERRRRNRGKKKRHHAERREASALGVGSWDLGVERWELGVVHDQFPRYSSLVAVLMQTGVRSSGAIAFDVGNSSRMARLSGPIGMSSMRLRCPS